MGDLKIFTNGYDTCIAETREQARRFAIEAVGESPDAGDMSPIEWWLESGATEIAVINRVTGITVTRTPADWIELNGPGFLCSTEF